MNSAQPVTVRPGAKKNDSLAQEKKHWAINRPCLPPLSHCRTQDTAKPIRSLPAPASGPHLPPPARAGDAPDAHVPTYRKRNHYLLGTFFHRRRQSISTSSLPPAPFPSRSSYLLTLPVRCCRCLFLPILLPPHTQTHLIHHRTATNGKNPTLSTTTLPATPRLGDDFSPRPFASFSLSTLFSFSFSSSCSVS